MTNERRMTMTVRRLGARTWGARLGAFGAALLLATSAWAQAEFPFEQEMSLDEKPMPGSKRVPMLAGAAWNFAKRAGAAG